MTPAEGTPDGDGPNRSRISLTARLRYRTDTLLSTGIVGIVAWLAAGIMLLAVVAAIVLTLLHAGGPDTRDLGFVEAWWMSLVRTLDPGTMGQDVGWTLRITSLIVTVAGILALTALIGLVSSSVDRRIERLRKGRSPVLESGHTVILGWSSKIFSVLGELIEANANQKNGTVVILAPRAKMRMDDDIHARFQDTRTTRVICRSGDPGTLGDLQLTNHAEARSIIVLRPDEGGDADVIRAVLALMADPDHIPHIVAEVTDIRNGEALRQASHNRVQTFASGEVIGRITAQVCRQAGLGVVYEDLLDFGDNEIYIRNEPEPQLVGRRFVDAVLGYDTSSVIGLSRAHEAVVLNPPMDTVIQDDDRVIAVSQDDDTIVLAASFGSSESPRCGHSKPHQMPAEHLLFLGWNDFGPFILNELGEHLADGSTADVLIDPELFTAGDIDTTRVPSTIRVTVGDAPVRDSRAIFERLQTKPYDRAVILCYPADGASEADAMALLSLVQLRHAFSEIPAPFSPPTIVIELRDTRDVELASVTGADDFIVSDRLTSLMLAQLAEDPDRADVFEDLFDEEGSLLCMRPVEEYVSPGEEVRYRDLVAEGCRRGEVVIGYRRLAIRSHAGVVMNPDKQSKVTFAPGDEAIVLARQANVPTPTHDEAGPTDSPATATATATEQATP